MREGVGGITLYNMIIIFIFIVFALLAATISYYKAFKVNSAILYSVDKFEGYNAASKEEITETLNSFGYMRRTAGDSCAKERNGMELIGEGSPHYYCVYYESDDTGGIDKNDRNDDNDPLYYNYGVVTYIFVDLPLLREFKVPVYTKGERIYNFSDGQGDGA